ncbi:hypothetical protein H072_6845 [Dactylellina haptotyla CBS 200.50]|uniref:Uncharacterized protein n=1 Tax=Dactylellina haptotyla (strain CBS 200.50) TaxID=1284197 RepID=S8BVR3_DACHA|nr:hypothetical protein H072_6845 [Dactylellina haptotyla CBS 200.50]
MTVSTAKSLSDLPYDILIHICDQLDQLRKEACKPQIGRPPIPTNPTHYVYFRPEKEELPPKKPHDSPRRAEQWRIEQSNNRRNTYDSCTSAKKKKKKTLDLPEPAYPSVFDGVSMFDGISRTNKYLRDICYPHLFKNVVLASNDCLTLDRLEFYSNATWILKHVRSLRFFVTYLTWPNSLGANTPKPLIPSAISNTIRLLTSIPHLQTLHFLVEPPELIREFRNAILEVPISCYSPPITFPTVSDLYIKTDMEWLIPLCGASSGLEVFEYEASPGIKSLNKVNFMTWGRLSSDDETEPQFNGMVDTRAVQVLRGLQRLEKNNLRKFTLAAFVHDTGIEQLAPFLQNVTELYLTYGIASVCATSLRLLPALRLVRFGQDEEPYQSKNPHCYMSRREMLAVARSALQVKEIWHRDRFVCHVKRLENQGDGTEVDAENTCWWDTWADDGIGKPEVISSGWLA